MASVLRISHGSEHLFPLIYAVILPWLLLALAPGWRGTMPIVTTTAMALSALYCVTMFETMADMGDVPMSQMFTFEGVHRLLADRRVVFEAWVHYAIFDLWMGRWEVSDARSRGVPQVLMLPCLFLTLMFGPAGFLLYTALIRPWFKAGRAASEGVAKEE